MRAVLYARYSSDLQSEASLEDQLRLCRRLAEREGWTIIAVHSDQALSGALRDRPGLAAIVALLERGAVDVVVTESLDRLSRDIEHLAAFHKRVTFHGARIVTLSEGAVTDLHVGLRGTMGAMFLKDLAEKTRRGQEGRIRAGRMIGSVPYGYRMVRRIGADGALERGLRDIDEAEATVVRRIFELYAAGASPRRIAQLLNDDGIAGPAGGHWIETSIRGRGIRGEGILRNPLYDGRIVWNRRMGLKDPVIGRRVRRDREAAACVTVAAAELGIVEHALWGTVQDRLEAAAATATPGPDGKLPGYWDRRRPRFLLSQKVYCGLCGGKFATVGKDYLACAAGRTHACRNRRSIRRQELTERVIAALRGQIMRADLLGAFVEAYREAWRTMAAAATAAARHSAGAIAEVDRRIDNLVNALAEEAPSGPIRTKLAAMEAQRDTLQQVHAQGYETVPDLPTDLGGEYQAAINHLADTLHDRENPRALELARDLIDRIVITPPDDDDDPLIVNLEGDFAALLTLAAAKTMSIGSGTPIYRLVSDLASSVKEQPGGWPLAGPGSARPCLLLPTKPLHVCPRAIDERRQHRGLAPPSHECGRRELHCRHLLGRHTAILGWSARALRHHQGAAQDRLPGRGRQPGHHHRKSIGRVSGAFSHEPQYSSRCWPPSAAATQAMNAPTSIDTAVKIERYAPALRAVSAAWRAFTSTALACAITSSTRLAASACDSPVRAATSSTR
jgi:DNA invertase Pin-like site-specific DNA recombinase